MRFPLELLRCSVCTLVQIGYEVDPRILFPHSYPYLSGTTRILRENFGRLGIRSHCPSPTRFKRSDNRCGRRLMALYFPHFADKCGLPGIEPSQAADTASKNGIPMVKGYFQ